MEERSLSIKTRHRSAKKKNSRFRCLISSIPRYLSNKRKKEEQGRSFSNQTWKYKMIYL
jgi:hypothetical protein